MGRYRKTVGTSHVKQHDRSTRFCALISASRTLMLVWGVGKSKDDIHTSAPPTAYQPSNAAEPTKTSPLPTSLAGLIVRVI